MSIAKSWFRARRSTATSVGPFCPSLQLLVPLVLVVLLGACADQPTSPDVVAASDLGEVTKSELAEFILTLPEAERKPSDGQELAAWHREKLEQLLVTRHLEEEARSRGLGESAEASETVAAQIESLMQQEVEARMLRERVSIGEAELQAFYDTHPEEFRRGEQVRLRHIFRRVRRDAPGAERKAVQAEMEQLLEELRDGANFEELAKARSDSETAPLGGLIGRVNRGTFSPYEEAIIWNLQEGEISDIVATPVGFHIFRLDDHLAPEHKELGEVRGLVTRRLTTEATEKVLGDYLGELLEASQAVYNAEGLSSADETTLLFELQDESMTLAEWRVKVSRQSFFAQRESSFRDLFDQWVRGRLYLWEAARSGLTEEPAVVQRMAELRREFAVSLAFREKQEEVIEAFDERELREYYEAQRRRYQTPRLFHLRLLTLSPANVAGKSLYKTYEQLDQLANEIRAGELEFSDAARRWSEDHSAVAGGDVGAIRLDSFGEWAGPAAGKTVAGLHEGDVSDPILIERYDQRNLTYERAGYMLVELVEIREPVLEPFDDVREEISREIARKRSVEIVSQIRDETLDEIHARVYEENL